MGDGPGPLLVVAHGNLREVLRYLGVKHFWLSFLIFWEHDFNHLGGNFQFFWGLN